MLFEKSLRRDITNLAGVVFASLFAIFLTNHRLPIERKAEA